MMQARYHPAPPNFLGEDDDAETDHYENAAQNVRKGAQTPPTPTTPSMAATPRSQGFGPDDGGRRSPLTPRSEDERSQIATPPPEDEMAELSYRNDTSPPRTGKAQHEYIGSPPRTGHTTGTRIGTVGTMGWTAEVDALMTPGGTRVGTGWASQADYDDMHELGNLAGENHCRILQHHRLRLQG